MDSLHQLINLNVTGNPPVLYMFLSVYDLAGKSAGDNLLKMRVKRINKAQSTSNFLTLLVLK